MGTVVDLAIGAIAGVAVAALILALARARRDDDTARRGQRSPARAVPPGVPSGGAAASTSRLAVLAPDRLPTFADVGGFDALKAELRDTIGLVLSNAEHAQRYRITWNGVLLHGLPGTGKSFLARALAGELGCSLVEVDTADLVTSVVGAGPRRVEDAFELAAKHLPCVLLFDELDSIAADRTDQADAGHATEILTQLLQSVEDWRREPRLIVVGTTNELEAIDPAIIRPGRFDRHVRVDLPDAAGRVAVLEAALKGRPVRKDLDLDAVARRTTGQTPAALVQAVELAALAALREAAGTGKVVPIDDDHIEDAIEQRGGKDRPMVERWSWDRLVLDAPVLAELGQIQALIEDPTRADGFGVDPPTGLLLTGPPGTGKTTIAKVLAAEAACSFYPMTAADLTSRWVGESERAVARLFRRARANCPSIIFLDEIDAIGASRGKLGAYDRQLDQLLAEIDGMSTTPGVYVIGATNRAEAVDPALRRGGRLSRTIAIALPDVEQRLTILELLATPMPLHGVDLEALAIETDGFSGADLKALLQQAALEAMIRQHGDTSSGITHDDVERARSVSADALVKRRTRTHKP
jgi:transitional endoplasmic reticulum ATPase